MNKDTSIGKIFMARIKSTQRTVPVYKLLLGGYCNADDHTTSYSEWDVELIKPENEKENNSEKKLDNDVPKRVRFTDDDGDNN